MDNAKPSSLPPIALLRRLADSGATGEFICAAPEVEIHAYLQGGRIAWATSSAHPLEFARHIQGQGRVDGATFRQVLDECRREKLPFGETLVAWGLVSREDVLAALRHQVGLALTALTGLETATAIFLERKRFTEYSPALTLELGSLEPATTDRPPPPPTAPPPVEAGPDLAAARRLQGLVRSVAWVELLEEERVVAALPGPEQASRVPLAFHRASLAAGVDFVALRGEHLVLAGVRGTGPRASLWIGLDSPVAYGPLVSALTSLGLPGTPAGRLAPGRSSETWRVGAADGEVARELAAVLEFSREVLAAVVLGPGGALVVGLGKPQLPAEACVALVRRRAPLFAAARPCKEREAARERLGFGSRQLITGESTAWCFGAEIPDAREQTLWVLTERSALQGLGWACVTALYRSLVRNEYLAEAEAR